ncbi:MAG: AMMECR1 domain-containing protein [bacterium]|nr:AMMECR1 domain-containing protein [bacterium]
MNIAKLARIAVETYIREGKVADIPKNLPEEFLMEKAGVFVSIFRSPRGTDAEQKRGTDAEKELRGCVGTYLPVRENIAQETIHNAVASASQDPRFSPVSKEDLGQLSYSVYILGEPKQMERLEELDPKKYGIIVKARDFPSKTGLLLPGLKGIDSVDAQIYIASQKAGIDLKKEEILIYRFEVEKYHD